jgi:transcription elongation factor Elf1
MKKIKCPYCGWERNVPTSEIVDESFGTIVRKGEIKALAEKIKAMLADPQLDEANAWIDLTCADCGNSYQYNVCTGKTRQ